MATSKDIIELANSHLGEEYVFGAIVPMNNPGWKGPWDCAEFVTYIIHSLTNVLYGIRDNDSYTGYWAEDAGNKKVISISIDKAARTEGAILLREPKANKIGHIAFSDGKGNTIEARGKAYGVSRYVAFASDGTNSRGWDLGIKIPNIDYLSESTSLEASSEVQPITLTQKLIKHIQSSLKAKGILLQSEPGILDDRTSQALYNFQLANSLEPSGLIDLETLQLLK